MKIAALAGGAVALLVLVFVLILGVTWVSYHNHEKDLRIAFGNEQRANQADYDNMWKTIAQKYEVKGDFEQTLKATTAMAVTGRTGGSLAKSIQEAYPHLDPAIYRDMAATIEGKRNQFESHQVRLSDLKAEHDKLVGKFPGSLFLAGVQPLELKMLTSGRTDKAFDTGRDDDVSLKTRQ